MQVIYPSHSSYYLRKSSWKCPIEFHLTRLSLHPARQTHKFSELDEVCVLDARGAHRGVWGAKGGGLYVHKIITTWAMFRVPCTIILSRPWYTWPYLQVSPWPCMLFSTVGGISAFKQQFFLVFQCSSFNWAVYLIKDFGFCVTMIQRN